MHKIPQLLLVISFSHTALVRILLFLIAISSSCKAELVLNAQEEGTVRPEKRRNIEDCEVSPAGIALIKQFEGFSTQPYRCSAGAWTIGYGQTIPEGQTDHVSKAQAETLLRSKIVGTYAPEVQRLVSVPLYQGEFDALVSLNYNIGAKVLCDPTEDIRNSERQIELIPLLNASRYEAASLEFSKFTKGGAENSHYRGLLKRRIAEMFVFRNHAEIPSTLAPDVAAYCNDPQNATLLREARELYRSYKQGLQEP